MRKAIYSALPKPCPEDKYSFVPTNGKFEGVRSFGEQIKHVACAQFAFFNEFEGKKLPMTARGAGTILREQSLSFSNT